MTDNDKPKVTATLKDLDNEIAQDPFIYMTRAGKRVVFPDPSEMDWREAEEFGRAMRDPNSNGEKFLIKYLGKDALDDLEQDIKTYRQMSKFMELVVEHYEAFFGTPGKDDASKN